MNMSLRTLLLVNGLWIGGMFTVAVLLVGGSLLRVQRTQTSVEELAQQMEGQRKQLQCFPGTPEYRGSLQQVKDELGVHRAMTDSEVNRIAELSTAARAAGITIVSFEGTDHQKLEDGRVVKCSHRVLGVGNYRQLAEFMAAIYKARGMASIDDFLVAPLESEQEGSLRVSLQVSWYGPGTVPPDPTEVES